MASHALPHDHNSFRLAQPCHIRSRSTSFNRAGRGPVSNVLNSGHRRPWGLLVSRRIFTAPLPASRADDSVSSGMSVEFALKLPGVAEGAPFDDILRAKNPIIASCKDDQQVISQDPIKNSPISVEAPSTSELGVQAGVYGALMVLTYVNGAVGSYAGADIPSIVLATSFGGSLNREE